MNIKKISSNFLEIAGPCSAESRNQILSISKSLKERSSVEYLRAGIWKPRTRPGMFEGVGTKGLKWLKEAKETFGIKVCTEVAEPKHVDACLKHGIDLLWIGARTTGNPFAIQALADSLAGTDIPVLVKNSMNPDLALWIGAIERLYTKGITKIGAIHRGFSTHEYSKYRNIPAWHIPIELKQKLPNIQLIVDPSHITGNPMLIQQVLQRAIWFGADGSMIEVHNNPEKAFSDARQQITPTQYKFLFNELKFFTKPYSSESELEKLRRGIDELDSLLISTIADRMNFVKTIGEYKKANQIEILQPARWTEVLNDRLNHAKSKGCSEDLIRSIFELLHEESIKIQSVIK